MATPIKLEEYQVDDFQVIRDLGPGLLEAVVQRLRELDAVPTRPDKLADTIAETLREKKNAAESIIREALMVYGWIRQGNLNVAEVQEGIRDAINTDSGWSDQDIAKWQSVEEAFGELLSLPILRLAASAIDLSYEYTNLWGGARILTDIRPIFNDEATSVDGAVVSHTFRLRFESLHGRHELNIAMDESDIHELAYQCDRALRKAHIARDLMRDRAKVPTVISGETENA